MTILKKIFLSTFLLFSIVGCQSRTFNKGSSSVLKNSNSEGDKTKITSDDVSKAILRSQTALDQLYHNPHGDNAQIIKLLFELDRLRLDRLALEAYLKDNRLIEEYPFVVTAGIIKPTIGIVLPATAAISLIVASHPEAGLGVLVTVAAPVLLYTFTEAHWDFPRAIAKLDEILTSEQNQTQKARTTLTSLSPERLKQIKSLMHSVFDAADVSRDQSKYLIASMELEKAIRNK